MRAITAGQARIPAGSAGGGRFTKWGSGSGPSITKAFTGPPRGSKPHTVRVGLGKVSVGSKVTAYSFTAKRTISGDVAHVHRDKTAVTLTLGDGNKITGGNSMKVTVVQRPELMKQDDPMLRIFG